MRAHVLAAGLVGTALSLAVAMLVFRFSFEKAALLAPIVVATAGATAFLFVLWTTVVRDALRRSRRPLVAVAAFAVGVTVLVLLSFVVDVPRYGH